MDVSEDGKKAYSVELNDVMYISTENLKDQAVIKLKCIDLVGQEQLWESNLDIVAEISSVYNVKELRINPNGENIILSYSKIVVTGEQLWDVKTIDYFAVYSLNSKSWEFKKVNVYSHYAGNDFYFSKDGNYIHFIGSEINNAGSEKNFLYKYDYQKGVIVDKIGAPLVSMCLAMNADRTEVVSGARGVDSYDLSSGRSSKVVPKSKEKMVFVSTAVDGDYVAGGMSKGGLFSTPVFAVDLWKKGEKKPLHSISIDDYPHAIDISAESGKAAVFLDRVFEKGRIEVYDLNSGQLISRFKNYSYTYDIKFLDKSRIIMGSASGVNIYNIDTKEFEFSRFNDLHDYSVWQMAVGNVDVIVDKVQDDYNMAFANGPMWYFFEKKEDNLWVCTKGEGALAENMINSELSFLSDDEIYLFYPNGAEGNNSANLIRKDD